MADQEEEKRARERIRQRIADDKVCCGMLRILLKHYTNNYVLLTVTFCQNAHKSSNKSFVFDIFIVLDFHIEKSSLCFQSQIKYQSLSL